MEDQVVEASFDFKDLGLSETSLNAIRAKGFETPSPIQRLAIPVLLNSTKDIIAQAQTGTGKTAAFGLPIMDQLEPNGKVQALVLAPTRELALQVSDEIISFKGDRQLSIATIYGGASMSEQLRRLKKGVDIVVGTPGRIIDHISRGSLQLGSIRWFILDEADEML
ncbi:MAG: DEAD/DEAH box helicase, partial [Prevotellaceae bacterium]|nr:DEAD/DEAH box helicase [Prevotellaceae bacterium]